MVLPIVKFTEDVFLSFTIMKPSAVLSLVKCNASEQRGTLHTLTNMLLFLQFRTPITQAVGKQLGDIISNCLILSLRLLTRKKKPQTINQMTEYS